jgi:hypothetical protein
MKIGTFGPKVFTITDKHINTFKSLARSSGYNVEEEDNGTGKPKLKKKSPSLETLSFDIELRSDFADVGKEIESWIGLKGDSYYFIVGREKVGSNQWMLTNVDTSNIEILPGGKIKKASLSLSLRENSITVKNSTAKSTRNAKG